MPSLEPRGPPSQPWPHGRDQAARSWEPQAVNQCPEPNASTQQRMELCTYPSHLPRRGLLPVETPARSTPGSPHPTLQNSPTQGLWDTAARIYRETQHCPVHPHCCRGSSSCLPAGSCAGGLGRVGNENSGHASPAQPRATRIWSWWPPHLNWHNFGGENRS